MYSTHHEYGLLLQIFLEYQGLSESQKKVTVFKIHGAITITYLLNIHNGQ